MMQDKRRKTRREQAFL